VIADRDARISALEKELHRLHDLIYKTNFGVQIHDTIPVTEVPEDVEPVLTEEQQAEKDYQDAIDERNLRLRSIARTRPSQLGPEMAREMVSNTVNRAAAAHPANRVFAAVRAEVNKS
jgi:16S rRNA C1402 N4-methylase RsmH